MSQHNLKRSSIAISLFLLILFAIAKEFDLHYAA